jgi:hypothetical protein
VTSRIVRAPLVERAGADKRELCAMIPELVDLAVIELDGAGDLRGLEQLPSSRTQTAQAGVRTPSSLRPSRRSSNNILSRR